MEGTAVAAVDFSPIVDGITANITPAAVIAVLGTCVAVGAGFLLVKFGWTKIKSSVENGLYRGRLSK